MKDYKKNMKKYFLLFFFSILYETFIKYVKINIRLIQNLQQVGKSYFALLVVVSVLSSTLFAQDTNKYNPEHYKIEDVCLSAEEYKLYNLINEYRATYQLKPIQLSRSLTYVAQVHIWDLINNSPVTEECNLHSWSAQKNWTECCYTADHKQVRLIWNKPSELTNYYDYGYEIACNVNNVNAEYALNGWKKSSGHNIMIINSSIWIDHEWNAIGIGLLGNYAVVWFGEKEDKEESPKVCE